MGEGRTPEDEAPKKVVRGGREVISHAPRIIRAEGARSGPKGRRDQTEANAPVTDWSEAPRPRFGTAAKKAEDRPAPKTFGKPAGKPTGRLEGAKPVRLGKPGGKPSGKPGAKPGIAGPRKPPVAGRGVGATGVAAGAGTTTGAGARAPPSKVVLMTMHRAKGREFTHVFAAGWEEGVFPLNPRELAPLGLFRGQPNRWPQSVAGDGWRVQSTD